MPSYKNVTQTIKVCKCLEYKKLKWKHIISVKYINTFKEKSNFVVDFTSMFCCLDPVQSSRLEY